MRAPKRDMPGAWAGHVHPDEADKVHRVATVGAGL